MLIRDSNGISKLPKIQLILPYNIRYIRGSLDIPLLSLIYRKHFLLDVGAKFSQEVWYNFGTCVRLQAHNDKLNLNGHFSQFISYLGNVLDATRIHWFRAFRVSNVNIVAGSVEINMCTTEKGSVSIFQTKIQIYI